MNFVLLCVLLFQPPAPALPAAPPPDTRLYSIKNRSLPPSPAREAREKRQQAAFDELAAIQKLEKESKTGEAVVRYEALLVSDAKDTFVYPRVLEALGDLYGQMGRTREAIDLYRKLVYVTPNQDWITSRSLAPDLRLKFALLLHKNGQYEESLQNYNVGMEKAAKYARLMDVRLPMEPGIFVINAQTAPTTRLVFASHMALAACRNHFDQAECIAHLNEALKLRPNYAPIHYYLAGFLLYNESGKAIVPAPPGAVAELEKAIALDTSASGDTKRVASFWLENFQLAAQSKARRAAQSAETGAK